MRVAQVRRDLPGPPGLHVGPGPADARRSTAFDFGASEQWMTAWARLSCASGSPTSSSADAAATATCSALGSAMPMSSDARMTMRRAMNRGVLPRLEHPGQVVQRRVDVAAAHRLDERADDVVVLVAVAVVAHRGPVDRPFQRGEVEFALGHAGRLERGQRPAGIPAGDA